MTDPSRYQRARAKLLSGWRDHAMSFKAVSFGLIGIVNSVVDYSVFLLARATFDRSPAAFAAFDAVAAWCHCSTGVTISLIAANVLSWIVAVSGSYIMNSSITFAAESGRKLSWNAYVKFVLSGIVGWVANTATLIVAAEVLLLPVWAAKAIAVLASFVVNFSLSHFVVFRARAGATGGGAKDGA